jgi:acid stress chaperone HdeB
LTGTGQQEDRVVMMNRGTCWVLICALLVASIAQAQTTIDVAKITCDQFVLMTVAEPEQIAIWLSGYYHGKRNSTTVDVQQLKDYARRVRARCLYQDKGGTLMEAVEKVLATPTDRK